jgi:hypothetical protein
VPKKKAKKKRRAKPTKRVQSPAKKLRNAQLLAKVASGVTIGDAAKELGMGRTQAREVLSAPEVQQMVARSISRIAALQDKAVDKLEKALELSGDRWPTALKAAMSILKSNGALKESIDVTHRFPKPTIIKRISGDEIEFGSKEGDER